MSLLTERRSLKKPRRYHKHSAPNGAFPRPRVPQIGGQLNLLHTRSLDRRNCPSVDDVFTSCDRRSSIRRQEGDQLRYFFRAIRPAERDAAE
jgi:hypothetical protein